MRVGGATNGGGPALPFGSWVSLLAQFANHDFGFGLDDVQCTGSEASIMDCPHLPWGRHNCASSEAVGLRCTPLPQLRLTSDSGDGSSGLLEVFHEGVWGTVCDDHLIPTIMVPMLPVGSWVSLLCIT